MITLSVTDPNLRRAYLLLYTAVHHTYGPATTDYLTTLFNQLFSAYDSRATDFDLGEPLWLMPPRVMDIQDIEEAVTLVIANPIDEHFANLLYTIFIHTTYKQWDDIV